MKRMFLLSALAGLFLAIGCGGNPEENNQTEHSNSAPGDGESGDADGDGEESCQPIEQCSAEMCGGVDDGCGGTIYCGDCACINGLAQVETCGVCDLGVVACGSGETGVGSCEKQEIPGAENCDELVFVDQEQGRESGNGSKNDPVTTLLDALSIAETSGARAIIVAGDDSTVYLGPVVLDRPLSVIGGYDSNWKPHKERPTIEGRHLGVLGDAPEGYAGFQRSDVVGISVQGVSEPIVVANFVVRNQDDTLEGGTDYGVHVFNASGLRLSNMEVHAGVGGTGRNGDRGADGADGEDGEDAREAINVSNGFGTTVISTYWAIDEALGGVNEHCPEANGGDGGRGGLMDTEAATDGEDALQALGGAAADYSSGPPSGGDGESAQAFTTVASPGLGGSPGGSVVDGFWIPEGSGSKGADGQHGSGGGGGGGGASRTGQDTYNIGSFGGAGGAGGCGGSGGEGGEPGGGSFGLFVAESDIVVERSSFFAGTGGNGGSGGYGGDGGNRGVGGEPSKWYERDDIGMVWVYLDWISEGGYGGSGTVGQNAGDGGGGAGGVSYGAYCSNASLTTVGTVRFSKGAAGQGGQGQGQNGQPGIAADSFQCD